MRRLAIIAALAAACASAPAPTPPAPVAAAAAAPAPAPWTRTRPPPPLSRVAIAAPSVTRVTLDTGLHVVVVEHHRRPVVTVNLVLAHGALADPPESLGMTFMAVHLASDFYETMGVNDMPGDERSFRRRVAELGGTATFDVESDYSSIQIAGYSADTAKYLRMIVDAVRHPRHGARSFDARRDMVLDLLDSIEAEDPEALRLLIAQSAFGEDHPYARLPIGTTETLNALELQEVMEQQQVVFVPTGSTLLIVGDVKASEVIAAVKSAFGNWQGYKDLTPMPRVQQPALPRNTSEIGFVERKSASTLLTCALRPLPEVSGDDPALEVLTAILGEGFGSRLGMALREENGLTYGANAEIVRRRQASALIACSALHGDKGREGLQLFRAAFERLRENPPADDEVRRAKALRLAEIESSYDDVLTSTRTWLKALTLGYGAPRLEQERAGIEKVTPKDVLRVAHAIFKPKTIRWVVSGDHKIAAQAVESSGAGKLKPYVPGRLEHAAQ
ncbi:MAG: insulinase family protein [Myxococcales bacterium]|nr:insulinase family protein [Myxococcales bacterium]